MVRLGVAELGLELFRRRSGCFPEAATEVQQEGAGGKAAQVVLPSARAPELSVNQQLVQHLLTCAYQGTVNSSDDTFNSAKELADSLGARFYHWEIDE